VIDSTAVVDDDARIGSDVAVGPYSVIGSGVEVGDGCRIGPHVVIEGPARLGRENRVYPFASIGADPQDKKYQGETTHLEIGDRNTIREYCSIHRGTGSDRGATTIGHDNWIMAYVHVAHDSILGDDITMGNCATLGGHVRIDDCAVLGGFAMIHQFCSLGAYSFCGMGAGVTRDVPPFVRVARNPARPHGINAVGLRRRDFSTARITAIWQAYRLLYRAGLSLDEARAKLWDQTEDADCQLIAAFLERSQRSIVR